MRDLEPARGLGLECDQKAEDKDEDADDNKEHDFKTLPSNDTGLSAIPEATKKSKTNSNGQKSKEREFWLSTHSPIVIPQTQLLTQSFVAITHLIRCHPQRQTLAVVEVVAAL
ncbi:hypothetical protein BY996DRAFT_6562116, partial [Phakopsora pachyrhizi]